jgi:hypothetical protein
MRPFCTSKDLWSFGWLRIFCLTGMLFGIAFQDLGGFRHPCCFAKRMALAVLLPLKMQLSFVHLSAFEFVTGSSCWGGAIALASNIRGSLTSHIPLAQVTTAIWNISHSTSLCSIKLPPSLSSSRSTVDKSSNCALLFGFSNNCNSASALRFCDPRM